MVRYVSFILLVLATLAYGQISVDHKGHPHGRVSGKSQKPKEIIDTLRLASGSGRLVLQSEFTNKQHTTKPKDYMYVTVSQLLTDTSQSVNYYATYWNRDTLIVKSSNSSDSSLVVIKAFVK